MTYFSRFILKILDEALKEQNEPESSSYKNFVILKFN